MRLGERRPGNGQSNVQENQPVAARLARGVRNIEDSQNQLMNGRKPITSVKPMRILAGIICMPHGLIAMLSYEFPVAPDFF